MFAILDRILSDFGCAGLLAAHDVLVIMVVGVFWFGKKIRNGNGGGA